MSATSNVVEAARAAGRRMTRVGWVATVAMLFGALSLGGGVTALVSALLVEGGDTSQAVASQTERVAKFNDAFEQQVKQISGRTLFHTPPAPREPEVPKEVKVDGPTPTPTRYGGPSILAMLGKTVWFDDGRRLSVGDPPDSGLEVVELRGPWSAILRWRGIEFDVPLFERTTGDFLQKAAKE